MSTLTLTNTLVAGTPEDINDVQQNFNDVVSWANGGISDVNLASNAVTTAKITDGAVTGAKLSDDVVGVYRSILTADRIMDNDLAGGAYPLGAWNTATSATSITASAFEVSFGTAALADVGTATLPLIYIDGDDFTISGRTAKLRIRAQVAANTTSPGTINFVVGLYPITVAGGADTITYTSGTVVTGSTATVAYSGAGTSAVTSHTSGGSAFSVPSDGIYTLGVVTSTALANNSAVSVHAQLQVLHT